MDSDNTIKYQLQLFEYEHADDPFFTSFYEARDYYNNHKHGVISFLWVFETINGIDFLPYISHMIRDNEWYTVKKIF